MEGLARQVVGNPDEVSGREEANGYFFWGLVAIFIAVPELLAAFSEKLKHEIPWPTISNLVGKDIERHHHWTATIVVGVIVLVAWHTATYPAENKKLGQPVGPNPERVTVLPWISGPIYLAATAVTTAVAALVADAAGANKNQLGYAIYLTLTALGVVVPSLLRYLARRVLAIPTLFATIALLRRHRYCHWVAAALVALLAVLCFHLALYPWPNYPFGGR